MNARHTKTVERAYTGRDKQPRVFLRGEPATPYLTDKLLNEGDAVFVQGNRAEKAR